MGPHIEKYLKELENDSQLKCWGVWLVIHRDTNQVVGDIGFKGKPDENNCVEIGYGIVPKLQNNGFATEAVSGIINWALASGKFDKITAECLKENLPSIKVLEKVGMNNVSSNKEMLYWEAINSKV